MSRVENFCEINKRASPFIRHLRVGEKFEKNVKTSTEKRVLTFTQKRTVSPLFTYV